MRVMDAAAARRTFIILASAARVKFILRDGPPRKCMGVKPRLHLSDKEPGYLSREDLFARAWLHDLPIPSKRLVGIAGSGCVKIGRIKEAV